MKVSYNSSTTYSTKIKSVSRDIMFELQSYGTWVFHWDDDSKQYGDVCLTNMSEYDITVLDRYLKTI